jgi:tripeptidyl-peptidase-1
MTPSPRVDSSCSSLVTPVCLQELYGLPSGKPNATGVRPTLRAALNTRLKRETQKTSLTVTGYLDEYAQQSDLKSFLQQYRPDLPANSSFTLQTIDGGVNPQGPSEAGFEANLDIELTVHFGVVPMVPSVLYRLSHTGRPRERHPGSLPLFAGQMEPERRGHA